MRNNSERGFTLIELLLAMTFLTFLLVFMVVATTQVMRSYNKGFALKQINQTARTTLEDTARILRTVDGSSLNTNVLAADHRFCVSGTSFIWNLKDETINRDTAGVPVGLIRVKDPGAAMCATGRPAVPRTAAWEPVDLLTNKVWVQELNVRPSVDRQLVELVLTLSTTAENAPHIVATKYSCVPDATGGPSSQGQFCAFATFITTVNTREGGR